MTMKKNLFFPLIPALALTLTGCGSNLCNTEDISLRADIVTRNCAHLQVEGNVTDRDPAMVWYAIGCEEEAADGPQG